MDRLSVSKIKCWLNCPAEYYLKYVLKIEGYNVYLDIGTALHTATENYHRDHHSRATGGSGVDYSHPVLQDYIDAYIASVPADEYDLTADGAPALEEYFRVTFRHPVDGRELPIPFSGRIDRTTPNGHTDTKSAGKSWSDTQANSDIQATAYIFKHWQETGELKPFRFLIVRKDWTPKSRFPRVQVKETSRTVEDFAAFFELCERVIYEIDNATTYPCKCFTGQHQQLITNILGAQV